MELGAFVMAFRSAASKVMVYLTICYAARESQPPPGVQPRGDILSEIALCLQTEVDAGNAKALDLAWLDVKPRGNLSSGEDGVRRGGPRHEAPWIRRSTSPSTSGCPAVSFLGLAFSRFQNAWVARLNIGSTPEREPCRVRSVALL